ncbi:MAG: DUF3137 domain-containing protein, partial [Bdellovibrionales bacterium]|nr:DUF3137 domain-containing protein [Bdellovibrionales bacterium]
KYLPEHAERLTSPVTKRTIVYQAITSTTLGTRQSASVLVKKDEGALMRTALKAKDFALDSMSTTKNIEMENSQFEKHFSVFSDDEVFARMCITPEIMHRFLEWHHLDFICEIGEQKLEFQFTFNEATDCFRLPDLAYETPSLDVLRRSVCAPLSELINILSVFEGNHLLTHP